MSRITENQAACVRSPAKGPIPAMSRTDHALRKCRSEKASVAVAELVVVFGAEAVAACDMVMMLLFLPGTDYHTLKSQVLVSLFLCGVCFV